MFTIQYINTIPEIDAYHQDTGAATLTRLAIDCRDRRIRVRQVDNDGSVLMAEHDGHIIAAYSKGHPKDSYVEEWIREHTEEIIRILDHYEDGRRASFPGLDEDAIYNLIRSFEFLCEQNDYYSLVSAVDYLQFEGDCGVRADMTDQELADLAIGIELDADDGSILYGVQEYLEEKRTSLINKAEG